MKLIKFRILYLFVIIFLIISSSTYAELSHTPNSIIFSHIEGSGLAHYGSSIIATYLASGEVEIAYEVLEGGKFYDGDINSPLHSSINDKDFTVHYFNVFSNWEELFSPEIDESNLLKWNTTRELSTGGYCDGVFNIDGMEIIYSNMSILIEDISDGGDCDGSRWTTSKNSDDILVQLNYIEAFTITLINTRGITSKENHDIRLFFYSDLGVLQVLFIVLILNFLKHNRK